MPAARVLVLTLLAMVAFACNSLLCRLALKHTSIDAATFTAVRIATGALMLWIIVHTRHGTQTGSGTWLSALALFVYAAGFSFAYVSLPASTGALLLFGAVQATMIGRGLWMGERLRKRQLIGLVLAFRGMRQRHTNASLSLRRVCADDTSTTANHSAPQGESMGTSSNRFFIASR